MDEVQLCLVPNVFIPPMFKVSKFEKFNRFTYPMNHLTLYCRKMTSYVNYDKLFINFSQDSLTGATFKWYIKLDHNKVQCWKDLIDMSLNKTQL